MNIKARLRIISVILAIGLLVYLVVALIGRIEPSYNGRTLTEWIGDGQVAYFHCSDPEHPETEPKWLASQAAVRAMRTNALPFLMRWIQAKDSPVKLKVIRWLGGKSWVRLNLVADSALQQHLTATYGFALLGRDADPVIPKLVDMTKSADRDHRFWGYGALVSARPDKETLVPVTARLLNDADAEIKAMAAESLFGLYPEEAKKLGVCEMFPEMCNPTNVVIHAH